MEELEENKISKEGQLQALIIETEKKLTKIQKDYEIEISVQFKTMYQYFFLIFLYCSRSLKSR